jgi:hypothetical protein
VDASRALTGLCALLLAVGAGAAPASATPTDPAPTNRAAAQAAPANLALADPAPANPAPANPALADSALTDPALTDPSPGSPTTREFGNGPERQETAATAPEVRGSAATPLTATQDQRWTPKRKGYPARPTCASTHRTRPTSRSSSA